MKIVPIKNVGVYHDSDTTFWHFGRIQDYSGYSFRAPDYFLKYPTIDKFVSSNYALKFATFHVAFPANNEWIKRFHQIYSVCDHVFVMCSELHADTVGQLIQLDLPRVSFFICGFINHLFLHAKIFQWMDWFITAGEFYRNQNIDFLGTKLQPGTKEKYFDVLLGCQRPHRDYVNDYVDNYLDDQCIKTYFRRWNVDLRTTDHIFESEGIEFLNEPSYYNTVHHVKYYGQKMNLSAIVPTEIYNKTYYSLVTETNSNNRFNFYTEKIVKPILAKRLFVVIAGKGYLKNLRNLGFQTFSEVIDESYDSIDDNHTRWDQALAQVSRLCKCSAEQVNKQISAVTQHNYNLMMQDWNGKFIRNLVDVLDQHLSADHKVVD